MDPLYISQSYKMTEEPRYSSVFGFDIFPSIPNIRKIFEHYSLAVKHHLKDLAEPDLAVLYGNYKQVHIGNNTSDQPWFYEFVALSKWNAWTECKDKPTEYAMFDYCVKADRLLIAQLGVEESKHILQNMAV